MTLICSMFAGHTPAYDLTKFINDNAITQANIQTIEFENGTWFLFYWA